MTTQNRVTVDERTRKAALNQHLEDLGWGVLLTTIGIIWLVPEQHVPQGSWLIAAGLIILGLNAVRYFKGINMSGLRLGVGVLALFAGAGAFFHVNLPLLAIALIVIGVCMLLRPLLEKDSTSSTADNWCCCGPREPASKQGPPQGHAVGR